MQLASRVSWENEGAIYSAGGAIRTFAGMQQRGVGEPSEGCAGRAVLAWGLAAQLGKGGASAPPRAGVSDAGIPSRVRVALAGFRSSSAASFSLSTLRFFAGA